MNDKPITDTVNKLQTRDPIDVIAGIGRREEGSVPADCELKSSFEVAWDLAH